MLSTWCYFFNASVLHHCLHSLWTILSNNAPLLRQTPLYNSQDVVVSSSSIFTIFCHPPRLFSPCYCRVHVAHVLLQSLVETEFLAASWLLQLRAPHEYPFGVERRVSYHTKLLSNMFFLVYVVIVRQEESLRNVSHNISISLHTYRVYQCVSLLSTMLSSFMVILFGRMDLFGVGS